MIFLLSSGYTRANGGLIQFVIKTKMAPDFSLWVKFG